MNDAWQAALSTFLPTNEIALITATTRPDMTRERLCRMPIAKTAQHYGLTDQQVRDIRDLQIGEGPWFAGCEAPVAPFSVGGE